MKQTSSASFPKAVFLVCSYATVVSFSYGPAKRICFLVFLAIIFAVFQNPHGQHVSYVAVTQALVPHLVQHWGSADSSTWPILRRINLHRSDQQKFATLGQAGTHQSR